MEILKELKSSGKLEHTFIIGGGQLYAEALKSPQCSAVHLTAVRICLPDAIYSCAAASSSIFACANMNPAIDLTRVLSRVACMLSH